jgi:hypothetical protein
MSKIKDLVAKKAHTIIRKEFADFFCAFYKGSDTWPGMTDQQLADALADSLVMVAERRGLAGAAMLQTLVHEMQDRINQKLN